MLTLAPELPGALELIQEARKDLPIVAVGHSGAGKEEIAEAVRRGANLATHVFNQMAPFHHRHPGILGALMECRHISASIIADGVHVAPEAVRLLVRMKGSNRVIGVSDCVSAAGLEEGECSVGPVKVELDSGICRNEDGKLAGSTASLDTGLRNLFSWLEEPWRDNFKGIVAMLSLQPAELLGLAEKGRIESGCDADMVLLDEDLRVLKTWVLGELVYDCSNGTEGTLI